jgi:hypothetical protein
MVSADAPHNPTFAGSPSFLEGGTRQGPMAQFLQQLPSAPMGQGFIDSARSYTVDIFSSSARRIIFCVASQTDFASAPFLSGLSKASFDVSDISFTPDIFFLPSAPSPDFLLPLSAIPELLF